MDNDVYLMVRYRNDDASGIEIHYLGLVVCASIYQQRIPKHFRINTAIDALFRMGHALCKLELSASF